MDGVKPTHNFYISTFLLPGATIIAPFHKVNPCQQAQYSYRYTHFPHHQSVKLSVEYQGPRRPLIFNILLLLFGSKVCYFGDSRSYRALPLHAHLTQLLPLLPPSLPKSVISRPILFAARIKY